MIQVAEGDDADEVCRWLYSSCAVISESPPGIGDVSSKGSSCRGSLLAVITQQFLDLMSQRRDRPSVSH